MSPTFVFDDRKLVMVLGSPGGSSIPSAVAWVIREVIEGQRSGEEAGGKGVPLQSETEKRRQAVLLQVIAADCAVGLPFEERALVADELLNHGGKPEVEDGL